MRGTDAELIEVKMHRSDFDFHPSVAVHGHSTFRCGTREPAELFLQSYVGESFAVDGSPTYSFMAWVVVWGDDLREQWQPGAEVLFIERQSWHVPQGLMVDPEARGTPA